MSETTVNIHFAKTHLSRLIEQVSGGNSVVIANAGRPVARLVPYEPPVRAIAPPGSLAGLGFSIGPDFDAPLDGLYDALAGETPLRRVAESLQPVTSDAAPSGKPVDPDDDARAQADGA